MRTASFGDYEIIDASGGEKLERWGDHILIRPDPQIICELAGWLGLDDELLKSGYEATMRYLIQDLSVTLEELKEILKPEKYVGRAPGQVTEFLAQEIAPLLARYPDEGMRAELKV